MTTSRNRGSMRGLVYCVYLKGVGHLKTALTVSEGLLDLGEIDFIQGSADVGLTIDHPRFHRILLPPMKGQIDYPQLKQLSQQLKERRKTLFRAIDFTVHYDYFLIEQIPFTKLLFWNEVHALISALRERNPDILICCSHRGIQRQKGASLPPQLYKDYLFSERRTVKIINEYFDVVFIHTDPKLITFDETFDHFNMIADKVVYTGFLAHKGSEVKEQKREKRIIVTTGSGKYGSEIFYPLLEVAKKLRDYTFIFVMGPLRPESIEEDLRKKVTEQKLSNVEFADFFDDFEAELARSALAITLGGTTVFSLYVTKTPAIVFPLMSNLDQAFIAKKFNDIGLVWIGTRKHFEAEKMLALVQKALATPYPSVRVSLNFNGVENTKRIIYKLVMKKRHRPTT